MADCDLVINGGRVMDPETNFDGVRNVGVKDSEVLKSVNPGQPIRFERAESRFQPLSVEKWTKNFHASPIDFGGGVPGSQPECC